MRKPCCDKQDTNKGAWSKQEDQKLMEYIQTHGEGRWRLIPQATGLLRCGKSCRLRWINYLRPDLKRGNFSEDEEDLIIKLHALLGNRWSLIAGRLPGRTDNEVKNYWNTHLRKKLIRMGLDPDRHRLSHHYQLRIPPHQQNDNPFPSPNNHRPSIPMPIIASGLPQPADLDFKLDLSVAEDRNMQQLPSSIDVNTTKEDNGKLEDTDHEPSTTLLLFK